MLTITAILLLVPYIQCHVGVGVVQLTPPITKLGESLFWDSEKQAIYLVDVLDSTVYQYIHGSNEVTHTKIDSKTIGAAIPIKGRAGEFIVAAYQDLLRLEWDGRNNTGKVTKLKKNFEFAQHEQFYEAKADSKGRLWIGTYQVINREKYQWVEGGGSLYSITVNKNDSVNIKKKVSNLTFPSGLCWSLDDRLLYHVDAHRGQIKKYKFDIDSGNLGKGEVFFDLANYPHLTGGLDALAIKEGVITVPLYNGSVILHIDEETAEVHNVVPSPVPLPTSVVFGGPHNKTAYIASSDFRLTELEKRLNPFDSKAVFAYTGYDFPNSPSHRIVIH
ncbi:regucalcin-like [Cylas formicarius]|uniref:regucalcin-like n=1 Tax=Cylas formicarius TaxID=197179 RepID=UPI0029586A65|nr:regucalcin-like [Cylas formicarius]